MNDDTDYPRCGNCQLYEHVAAEDRTGRQWLYATGRCAYKPPSSHRPVKPKTADTNWCHNWRAQVDVSKAIIEEGNRRYESKKLEPEEALTLPDEGEPEPPEQELFVDRSYRPIDASEPPNSNPPTGGFVGSARYDDIDDVVGIVTEQDIEELAKNYAARSSHLQNLMAMNMPKDPHDQAEQTAAFHTAEAKAARAYRKLQDAKERYALQD